MDDCTLLLSTYDGGEDLWEGFFKALSIQWPEFDMPIVINTESKYFKYGNYNIKCVHTSKKKVPWGKRLKDVLLAINTDYILLFLEDYWLDDKVDNEYFCKCLEWLKTNQNISTFSFYPCMPGENIDDNKYERMEKRPLKCKYKLNCQVSIWRKNDLFKYVKNHESPWEWEVNGSIRANRYKKDFYTLKEGAKKCFSYGDPALGCMVRKGKWVKEIAIPMANKYGIDIDFSKRGFVTIDEINQKTTSYSFIERIKAPNKCSRIKNRIKRKISKIKSLI